MYQKEFGVLDPHCRLERRRTPERVSGQQMPWRAAGRSVSNAAAGAQRSCILDACSDPHTCICVCDPPAVAMPVRPDRDRRCQHGVELGPAGNRGTVPTPNGSRSNAMVCRGGAVPSKCPGLNQAGAWGCAGLSVIPNAGSHRDVC